MADEPVTPGNAPPSAGPNAVLCVKCDHLCALDLERCDRCGAHLYVICSKCEHKNPRVLSRCRECGRRLHKTVGDRVRNRSRSVNLLYFAGAVLVIIAVAALVIWLADIPTPRLW